MASIGILGAGTWGMALARMLFNKGHQVTVWSALPREIEELKQTRRQRNLPDMEIPGGIAFTADAEAACRGMDIVLFAVPSVYVRGTVRAAAPFIEGRSLIVTVVKGMDPDTLETMSQVIRTEGKLPNPIVALSGPTHAEEVACDLPTAIVSACEDLKTAEQIQDAFSTPFLRVYTNVDALGVELCGALKNIIALAVGISAGLGYGDNARAALITRGLAEITRLGVKMGCMRDTFSGLAGVGDLIVTATSRHSRNNLCGYLIGQGAAPRDAIAQVGMVVEGVNALPAAMKLAEKYEVELPITRVVDQIIHHGANPADAVSALMGRKKKMELQRGLIDRRYEAALGGRTGEGELPGGKRIVLLDAFDGVDAGLIDDLRRARALGDCLIAALPTDGFPREQGAPDPLLPFARRKALAEALRPVDQALPVENWDQLEAVLRENDADTLVLRGGGFVLRDGLRAGWRVVSLADAAGA